jgi:hypothetical protein
MSAAAVANGSSRDPRRAPKLDCRWSRRARWLPRLVQQNFSLYAKKRGFSEDRGTNARN